MPNFRWLLPLLLWGYVFPPSLASGPVAYAATANGSPALTASSPSVSTATSGNGNLIGSLFGSIKNTITRTIDGCQELWVNYGTCQEIRAKIKRHQDALSEEWVRQGLYEPKSKQLKERLTKTVGGITFEEYAFLQQGEEDRGKLMSLGFLVFGAPRFLPYALMFQPEMLPSPLKPPFDSSGTGETFWEKQSRERSTVILETLLQLEKDARNIPGLAKLNIFGRSKQNARMENLRSLNQQAQDFLETTGTATREGARQLLNRLEPWLYASQEFERPVRRLTQVPMAITKGLGDALLGGGFLNNFSPGFMQRGRLVGHLRKVEEADQFLVDANVNLATIPPTLLRQTCSERLIGSPGMSLTDLQASLGDWLTLVQREPAERQATSSVYYNGNLARTALLGYYAMQGTQDKGGACHLPRALYQAPAAPPSAREEPDSSATSSSSSDTESKTNPLQSTLSRFRHR